MSGHHTHTTNNPTASTSDTSTHQNAFSRRSSRDTDVPLTNSNTHDDGGDGGASRTIQGITSLTSVLNDPRAGHSWGSWLTSLTAEDNWEAPVILPAPGAPVVEKSDFSSYLSKISELYRIFEMNKAHSNQPGELSPATTTEGSPFTVLVPPSVSEIPSIFFQPDFNLEDPTTFETVCGDYSEEHQDQFSYFTDIVEMELLRQISSRSDSFFSALSTLQDLYGDVQQACQSIGQLRGHMARLDEQIVGHALRIAQLRRQRDNVTDMHRKLTLAATLRQTQPMIQLLLSGSDFVGALDLIHNSRDVLHSDLEGIHCFRHVGPQLNEMLGLVEKMMISEFVQLAVGKKGILEEGNAEATGVGEDQEALIALTVGLLRASRLSDVLQTYRTALAKEAKNVIKHTLVTLLPPISSGHASNLGSGAASGGGGGGGAGGGSEEEKGVAERLKQLDKDAFLHLLSATYSRLQTVLSRAAHTRELILAVVAAAEVDESTEQSAASKNPTDLLAASSSRDSVAVASGFRVTKEYRNQIAADTQEVVCSLAELMHGRCARLLSARAHSNARLGLVSFGQLFDATVQFVVACEKSCSRQLFGLRGSLMSQAKSFLDLFHKKQMAQLQLLLNNESWQQLAEVPSEFQEMVRSFEATATSSQAPEMNGATASLADAIVPEAPPVSSDASEIPATTSEGGCKKLMVRGEGFHVVSAVLMVLKMVDEYHRCCQQLNALGGEIVHRLCELFSLFNSQSYELILKAKAMQVAKLKAITAKHLALASQAIGLLVVFVPVVMEAFKAQLSGRQQVLVSELERVLRDVKSHHKEIFTMLVTIMKERLEVHCRDLSNVGWEDPSDPPSPYMKQLVKETANLHRVLSSILPLNQVREIFSRVSELFHKKLSDYCRPLDLTTARAKGRLHSDLTFLTSSMQALEGVDFDDSLLDFFTSRFGSVA